MKRWRFTYRDKPAGPWRPTRREAIDDAVKAGEATRSEHNPERVFWNVFAGVETEGD